MVYNIALQLSIVEWWGGEKKKITLFSQNILEPFKNSF